MIAHTWLGEEWLLHPERCIFWKKEKMLIISDLHIGKAGHFRREGIGVPTGIFKQDVKRLAALIRFFRPEEIIFTGDLFHSRANLEWEFFARWRNLHRSLTMTLVPGNHDTAFLRHAHAMDLQICPAAQRGAFGFVHDPAEHPPPAGEIAGLFAGHIHPAVKIPVGMGKTVRLPCFYFTQNVCILPAFSLFTGTSPIKPHPGTQAFAITATEVIAL